MLPDTGLIAIFRAQLGQYSDLPADRILAYQPFKPHYDALMRSFPTVADMPSDAAMAIVHVTRSRDESLGLIAGAWAALDTGGWLIVDGDKSNGIDGIWKALRTVLPGAQQDSKAHGRVIWAQKSDAVLPDWQNALAHRVNADGFVTTAGVFSEAAADKGSAALAAHLDGVLSGKGADFGAGWGWLSQELLRKNGAVTALDMIEADARALDCARENVADPRARFVWGDATQQPGTYDFIVTNPPFHLGRKPDPSLGRAFISAAARALSPKGVLWLVANRQLAYEDTLNSAFGAVDAMSQSGGFKVIRARKPRT